MIRNERDTNGTTIGPQWPGLLISSWSLVIVFINSLINSLIMTEVKDGGRGGDSDHVGVIDCFEGKWMMDDG